MARLLNAAGNWICRLCRTENTNRNGSCRVCGTSIA